MKVHIASARNAIAESAIRPPARNTKFQRYLDRSSNQLTLSARAARAYDLVFDFVTLNAV